MGYSLRCAIAAVNRHLSWHEEQPMGTVGYLPGSEHVCRLDVYGKRALDAVNPPPRAFRKAERDEVGPGDKRKMRDEDPNGTRVKRPERVLLGRNHVAVQAQQWAAAFIFDYDTESRIQNGIPALELKVDRKALPHSYPIALGPTCIQHPGFAQGRFY